MQYLEALFCVSYLRVLLLNITSTCFDTHGNENVNFIVNTFHFRKEIIMFSEDIFNIYKIS